MASPKEILQVGGREVAISNPSKVYFPETGYTKLDLVQYYLAVGEGALRGVAGRPMALKRFVDGAAGEAFFQKRAPDNRPEWIRTAELTFPSGRTADEIVLDEVAGLAWVANLGCIDLNPHPVRADDLDHPDELRVDLDPVPGVEWPQIREVALVCREALEAVGLVGWPKTSGSRGIHINVRIERRWTYPEVRRAALALARDVERRAPHAATSKWWKEERHGVFLDYNQNAKDRTVASAYSVRPLPDARVSTPLVVGRGPDRRGRGVHARDGARPGMPRSATPVRGSTTLSGRSRPCSSCLGSTRPRARATPRGRRTTRKQAGEPPRVQPSKAASEARGVRARSRRSGRSAARGRGGTRGRRGGRRPERRPPDRVGRLATHADRSTQDLDPGHRDRPGREEGRGHGRPRSAGRRKHPAAAAALEPADILVDGMRGRSSLWYRVRVNLIHVPEAGPTATGSRSRSTTTRGPATSGRTGPGSWIERPRKKRRSASPRRAQIRPDDIGRMRGTTSVALLERLGDGWNRGDAAAAASVFADDVVYGDPTRYRFEAPQRELLPFFEPPPDGHRVEWHRVVFDASDADRRRRVHLRRAITGTTARPSSRSDPTG